MAINQDTKTKTIIYGTNFLTPSLINFFKSFPRVANTVKNTPVLDKILNVNMANPIGAAYFGVLEILGGFSDKIKQSKLTGLSKVVGLGLYAVHTVKDIFSVASGNYEDLTKLLFDSSMLYQLGKDSFEVYGPGKKDLWQDLTKW